ncbi:MAG: hypothetical protein KF862_04560 [Chitinophagaceae bacterium]|nr:hypothetical protein [Chitinophagaceae bacterium]
MKHLFTIILLLNILLLQAQDSQFIAVAELPPGYTSHIDKKLNGLDNRLTKQFNNAGSRMDRLLSGRYLPGIDSLATSLSFLQAAENVSSKVNNIQRGGNENWWNTLTRGIGDKDNKYP